MYNVNAFTLVDGMMPEKKNLLIMTFSIFKININELLESIEGIIKGLPMSTYCIGTVHK